jgi:hypothetical protein
VAQVAAAAPAALGPRPAKPAAWAVTAARVAQPVPAVTAAPVETLAPVDGEQTARRERQPLPAAALEAMAASPALQVLEGQRLLPGTEASLVTRLWAVLVETAVTDTQATPARPESTIAMDRTEAPAAKVAPVVLELTAEAAARAPAVATARTGHTAWPTRTRERAAPAAMVATAAPGAPAAPAAPAQVVVRAVPAAVRGLLRMVGRVLRERLLRLTVATVVVAAIPGVLVPVAWAGRLAMAVLVGPRERPAPAARL